MRPSRHTAQKWKKCQAAWVEPGDLGLQGNWLPSLLLRKSPLKKGGGARLRAPGDIKHAVETSPCAIAPSPFKGGIDFHPHCCARPASMGNSSKILPGYALAAGGFLFPWKCFG